MWATSWRLQTTGLRVVNGLVGPEFLLTFKSS
jgi:hypothetical protein